MTVHTLGDGMLDAKPRPRFAWQWQPLVPIGIAAFSLSSLISYHVRQPEVHSALQAVVSGIYRAIGFVPACMFFILVLAWSSIWFVRGELVRPGARLLRLCGFTLATAMLVNLRSDAGLPMPVHAGVIGHWLATRLMNVFGYVLSILMVAPAFFVSFVLATDWFFARFFDDLLTSGPRGHGDRLGGEVGVEEAATEHLKGLALAGLQPGLPASASRVAMPHGSLPQASPLPFDDDADEDDAEMDAMASAIAETAEDTGEERLRLTAFERRQLAAEQLAAAIERASMEAEAEDEAEALAEAEAEAEAAAAAADGREPAVDLTAFDAHADDDRDVDRDRDRDGDGDKADEVVEPDPEAEAGEGLDAVVSVPTVRRRAVPVPGLEEPVAAAPAESESESEVEAEAEAESAAATEVPVEASALADRAEERAAAIDDAVELGLDEDEDEDHDEVEVEVEPSSAAGSGSAFAASDAGEAAAAALEAEAEVDLEADADADAVDVAAHEDAVSSPQASEAADEPTVSIPRPPERVRQRRLFAEASIDDNLVREAESLILDSRRASATMLQRKLRIDYEQAMAVMAALAERGIIEMQEGESTGRVLQ